MKWKSFEKEKPEYKSGKSPIYCITGELGFNIYFASYCRFTEQFFLSHPGIDYHGPIIIAYWYELPEPNDNS